MHGWRAALALRVVATGDGEQIELSSVISEQHELSSVTSEEHELWSVTSEQHKLSSGTRGVRLVQRHEFAG